MEKKHNVFKTLKKLLCDACVTFTIVVFVFYLIMSAITENDLSMDLTHLLSSFAFSLFFAAANLVLERFKGRTGEALRVFLHFAITLTGFIVVFLLLPQITGNGNAAFQLSPGKTLVAASAFTLLYLICALMFVGVRKLINKGSGGSEEYEETYAKTREIMKDRRESK